MIGAAAAVSMRSQGRRTIASDLHVSSLSSVPVSCGFLYPNGCRNCARNCSSAQGAATLHTSLLAEAPVANPAPAGHPATQRGPGPFGPGHLQVCATGSSPPDPNE